MRADARDSIDSVDAFGQLLDWGYEANEADRKRRDDEVLEIRRKRAQKEEARAKIEPMPPTDGQIVDSARATLIALTAELHNYTDRVEAWALSAEIRAMVARTKGLVQPGAAYDLVDIVHVARERIVQRLGRYGWEASGPGEMR